jgi:tyrosine-specific transport protein
VTPLGFVLFYPHGFTVALSFAGIFVAILLGILPAMMAWQGRSASLKKPLQIIGGKPMIIITILFFIFVGAIECFKQFEALWGHKG